MADNTKKTLLDFSRNAFNKITDISPVISHLYLRQVDKKTYDYQSETLFPNKEVKEDSRIFIDAALKLKPGESKEITIDMAPYYENYLNDKKSFEESVCQMENDINRDTQTFINNHQTFLSEDTLSFEEIFRKLHEKSTNVVIEDGDITITLTLLDGVNNYDITVTVGDKTYVLADVDKSLIPYIVEDIKTAYRSNTLDEYMAAFKQADLAPEKTDNTTLSIQEPMSEANRNYEERSDDKEPDHELE